MKKFTFFIPVVCMGMSLFSQVGIGTDDPDPSSLLEMNSTTQGMLTPRMTSAERTSIVNPAEGLFVYDTDEGYFYYFASGSWMAIDEAKKRDNYKLVKSTDDLSDELSAGGGSTYLLDENTLYEINGIINLAAPININNAYLFGKDSGEDVLVRSGGVMFSGASGGTIRRVTLQAPSGTIFSLNGGGTDDFVIKDAFIDDASNVGTISNFDLVFFRAVIFTNNSNGITFTDINEIFMADQGWEGSNGGTYKTFSGDFNLIQKTGGFMEVTTATAGLDVTGITSISGNASLKGVSFFGGGNYINGTSPYTGYNFTNEWNVDSPGIPKETNENASGNFYFDGTLTTGFSQNIFSDAPVEVQGSGSFTSNELFRFASSGGGNRLTYEGLKGREFTVNASLSIRVISASGNFYAFVIAKNGTVVTESNVVVYIQNDTQIQNVALNANLSLDTGDYIEVFAERLTGGGTDTLVVFSENLSIK